MKQICKTVALRTRTMKNGMLSFYLDYYPGFRDHLSMKTIRHETIGIYIYENPRNNREKEYNKLMTEKAEAIRCRRFESIVNERYDFFDKTKMKGDFLAYFKTIARNKNEKWDFVYAHFEKFVGGKCTFEEVDYDLCNRFRDIKGLQTMISNLEKEKANLNRESDNLNWELMMKKGNAKQIEERKAAIERDLEEVKQKINDKNQKLISVEKELFHKQEELDSMSADVQKAYSIRKPIQSVGGSYAIPKITSKPPTFGADSWVAKQNEMIKEAFKDTVQKMATTYQAEANRQIEEAQKNVIYDYSELHHLRADNQHLSVQNQELNSQLFTLLDQFSTPNLRSAVLALASNIINDPNYSSGGGGGENSELQWDGRKPGEDEDSFARRCLLYASQQVARNRKKGLHR